MKRKKIAIALLMLPLLLSIHILTFKIYGIKTLKNKALVPYFTPPYEKCDTLIVMNFIDDDHFDSPKYFWPDIKKDSSIIKHNLISNSLIFLGENEKSGSIDSLVNKHCSYRIYMKKPFTFFPDIICELFETVTSSDGYQYSRTTSCRWVLFTWFERMEILDLNHPCN